jgi:hypothetical protein
MNSQNNFSFFKDKTPRFDWAVLVISGGALMVISFSVAWYFLGVTQGRSGDVTVKTDNTIELDQTTFDQAEKKFLKRRDTLATFLIDSEVLEEVLGEESDSVDDEEGQKDLEDA